MTRFAALCVAVAMGSASGQTVAQPAQTPAVEQNPAVPPDENAAQRTSSSTMPAGDLRGQTIYTKKGRKIGTVAAMSPDKHGDQVASVTVVNYPGLSGKVVLIPVSTLRSRTAGGYATTLDATELKALPMTGTGPVR